MSTSQAGVGVIRTIRRYPVKSMLGEEMASASFDERGLEGDRRLALIDQADGKVVSAKNPRKWGKMFHLHASLIPALPGEEAVVEIRLPDGRALRADRDNVDGVLSALLGRAVTLSATPLQEGRLEHLAPPAEAEGPEQLTEEKLPAGTFVDCAPVHLLTTACLRHLQGLAPESDFDVRRFRPNLLIETPGAEGMVEMGWIGRELLVGDTLRLRVLSACPRCVMPGLAQDGLAEDRGVPRTVARHARGEVGVYAEVIHPGVVRTGDEVRVC